MVKGELKVNFFLFLWRKFEDGKLTVIYIFVLLMVHTCSATSKSSPLLVRSEIKRYKWKDRIMILSRRKDKNQNRNPSINYFFFIFFLVFLLKKSRATFDCNGAHSLLKIAPVDWCTGKRVVIIVRKTNQFLFDRIII